jgi:hypothetical protein
MKAKTCAASLAAFMVTGCADMAAPKVQGTGTPAQQTSGLAQCSHNPGYQRSDNCCILASYVSALDVDTAFSRAMREYRFPPRAEGKGRSPERIYRYQSVKGQYHSVANDVVPQGDRVLSQGMWLFLTLERETDSSSSVSAAYCEIPGRRPENPGAWHAAVQQSIRATVPPK